MVGQDRQHLAAAETPGYHDAALPDSERVAVLWDPSDFLDDVDPFRDQEENAGDDRGRRDFDLGRCFGNEDAAREYLEHLRWGDCLICPKCGEADSSSHVDSDASRPGLIVCRACRGQFTVTVGTAFHRCHTSLKDILYVIYMMCTSRDGITTGVLREELNVTYNTCYFLIDRIANGLFGESAWALVEDKSAFELWARRHEEGGKTPRGLKFSLKPLDLETVLLMLFRDRH